MRSGHLPPPTHTQRVTGPSIAVSHTRLDLGEGRPGEQLEGSFTVSNRGSEPLEFTLSASCGCSFVRPMAGTLAPGESQRITLGIRLPQAVNSEKSTQVAIQSNDPRQPQVVCAAAGRAPAPWEVSATVIDFGYVLRDDLHSKGARTLIVRRGKGKNGQPPSVLQVRVSGAAFSAATYPRDDGSLLIEVQFRPGPKDGRYGGMLYLGKTDELPAIDIPLNAEVGPGVALAPKVLRLRTNRLTGGYETARLYAFACSPGLTIPAIRPMNAPEGILLRDRTIGAVRRRIVELEFAADLRLPPQGISIELTTDSRRGAWTVILLPPLDAACTILPSPQREGPRDEAVLKSEQ